GNLGPQREVADHLRDLVAVQTAPASRTPTRRYRVDTMFYEVLVISDGGERFTIERDAPLAAGDSFPNESEFYRVLAIEPGHGPFAGVIQAERLSTSGSGEVV